jgi:Glutathione S-transferase, N-terminal domain
MKLYVCFDFAKNIRTTGRPGGHPCGNAYRALKDAGYTPEVEPVHGLGLPPFNRTDGRRRIKELTGSSWVPVLVTDNGDVITDSKQIVAWAAENPAA